MDSRNHKPVIKEHSVTYDDYAQLPDDGKRYELADGALELMTPVPTPKHQAISNQIQSALTNSCQPEYIIFASPIDLILPKTEVRQPDIVMVHHNKMDIITRRGIEGIPDMIAEILSPHSLKRDKINKREVYVKYQIPEYWIIDPLNESLELYRLRNSQYELHQVFERADMIESEQIPCAHFTMGEIMDIAADMPG